ncbi:MAG: hypothetical protein RLZZ458_2844 [Planctomycetota bacterium]
MSTIILFVCGCILCLLFLGALYADHVHVGFLFEGRWLGPLFSVFGRFWLQLAESFEAALGLVISQLSWVVAALSGGIGLLLILFMLGGGLAADAGVWHRDLSTPMQRGGVLDRIPVLTREASGQLTSLTRLERDDSDLFAAGGGRYLVFNVPDAVSSRPRAEVPQDSVIRDIPDSLPTPALPGMQRPRLSLEFRRLGTPLSDAERYGEQRTLGELLEDLPDRSVIERALSALSFDGWRPGLGSGSLRPAASELAGGAGLTESTAAEVQELEQGVRVYPGGAVSGSDLEISKQVPEESEDGLVRGELRLKNSGEDTIDGLLVRERLPRGTQVISAEPLPTWRDDELVWRLDDLRGGEERILVFTLMPEQALDAGMYEDTVFVTETAISAMLAVKSRTEVVEDDMGFGGGVDGAGGWPDNVGLSDVDGGEISVGRRRSLPDVSTLELPAEMDVRLAIDYERAEPAVGAWTKVYFQLQNRGQSAVSGMQLRVVLDNDLDHPRLNADSPDRSIMAEVGRLEAGETRQVELAVRPLRVGDYFCVAELLRGGVQAGVREFDLRAVVDGAGR